MQLRIHAFTLRWLISSKIKHHQNYLYSTTCDAQQNYIGGFYEVLTYLFETIYWLATWSVEVSEGHYEAPTMIPTHINGSRNQVEVTSKIYVILESQIKLLLLFL